MAEDKTTEDTTADVENTPGVDDASTGEGTDETSAAAPDAGSKTTKSRATKARAAKPKERFEKFRTTGPTGAVFEIERNLETGEQTTTPVED
ncbi:hypothetical protein [Gordonia sp. NB41Y]|uniref:hypothetical protein n=1 Tax=Gordonia sp. NB41Y TaxID=875808 RepID=UPI0002BF79B5|nr:hypothetical protein [Gordonia sp. NB41Y]EMP15053.1 hypothetical protein ISGA_27 [Gordonia sp. NB41Y]WLP91324.1 hypothetical protein Q9K23_03370 [Gordonia sp. NB41Y]